MKQIDKILPFKRTINSPLHDARESWWLIVIELHFYFIISNTMSVTVAFEALFSDH